MKAAYSVLVALFTLTVFAQPALASSDKQDSDIEVIEITGERPVRYFNKIRLEKAENFMQTFNKYVEDEDLAFECERYAPIGTRIKKTVCMSAFSWRIYDEMMQVMLSMGGMLNNPGAVNWNVTKLENREIDERKRDLYQAVYTLIQENEDVAKAFVDYEQADTRFKKAHALKHGDTSKFSKTQ